MDLAVLEVVGPHPERLAAHTANVGLLARVESGVNFQIPGRLEGLAANLAGEFALRVDVLPMAVHGGRAPEAFAAIDARDGAVSRVLPHVDLQPVLVDERGAAVRALVRLGAQMSLEVLVQRALVAHGLLADVADVLRVLVPFVDLPVTFERMIGGESSSALLAFELFQSTCKGKKKRNVAIIKLKRDIGLAPL